MTDLEEKIIELVISQSGDGWHMNMKSAKEIIDLVRADKTCVWVFNEDGYFHTGCDYDYSLVDGTLEENSHYFCPKCGGKILPTEE